MENLEVVRQDANGFFASNQFDTITEVLILILALLLIVFLIIKIHSETKHSINNFLRKVYNKPKPDFTSGSMLPIPNSNQRIERLIDYLKAKKEIKREDFKNNFIGDAVCFNNFLLENLFEIEKVLINYAKNHNKKRPLNIFLNAPPGSGKSFLVENLIKHIIKKIDKGSRTFEYDKNEQEFNLSSCDNGDKVKTKVLYKINKKLNDLSLHVEGTKPNNPIPVFFIDEFDSNINNLQAFSKFINLIWEGRLPIDTEKEKRKAVFFFASSLNISDERSLQQLLNIGNSLIADGKISLYSLIEENNYKIPFYRINKKALEEKSYRLKYNIKSFKLSSRWMERREELLHIFKSQKSINKVNDFFDRVDYFINIPGYNEVFVDKNGSYIDDTKPYFSDFDNLYIILGNIEKYFGIKKVRKKALIALLSMIYSTKRDLDRRLFTSCCNIGDEYFEYKHLDNTVRNNFERKTNHSKVFNDTEHIEYIPK